VTRSQEELIATKRAISLGKLIEFQFQCERLAELVEDGVVLRVDAVDTLFKAALDNNLIRIHGVEYIQQMLAAAFESVAAPPVELEVAA
jgi:hypothetical protein